MSDETNQQPDATTTPAMVPANADPSLLATPAPESAVEAPPPDVETPSDAAPAYSEFKAPEGTVLDEAGLAAATELFKEAGLPQEQAQKFIDLAVAREKAAAERSARAFVDMQNKWVSEIKADPDIGGDKLGATIASATRAIDRLGVPGLKEALDFTGAGNNPAIVKAFARMGRLLSEDRFAPGHSPAPAAQRSPAEIIYGATPRQSTDV